MKRILAASILVLAFSVSGCVFHDPATKPIFTASERNYLDELSVLASPDIANVASTDPNSVISLGRDMCKALDRGVAVDQIAEASLVTGFSEYNTGIMIGASVKNFCPGHTQDVRNFVDSIRSQ